jgi:HAD superfamily hydrolase (TIGR01509 family)
MDVQTLVFDFGNVVGLFDHRLTTNRLAQHAELAADELHARLFGSSLEDDYESGKLTTAEFLRKVRETCGLTCSEETVATAWANIFSPNQEICALLPRLKPHYRLLLASNTNELHSQRFCCQFADTLRYFDALVLSYQIGVRKPRAAFFEHCQRLAACPADNCLFIDDLPANVAGAVACGWQGILYTGSADLLKRFAALGIKGLGAGENTRLR